MSAPVRQRGFLLTLAAESLAPRLAGCAQELAGKAPVGRAIDLFGPPLVQAWRQWLLQLAPGLRLRALSELADYPAAKARQDTAAQLDQLASTLADQDRAAGLAYLSAIPRALQNRMVLDPASGMRTLSADFAIAEEESWYALLPLDAPALEPNWLVPGTSIRLGDYLDSNRFGGVYRAHDAENPGRRLELWIGGAPAQGFGASELARILDSWRERDAAAGELPWERLVGFALETPGPVVVYETTGGGTLAALVRHLKDQTRRGFPADEALRIVEQIARGLSKLHLLSEAHGAVNAAQVRVGDNGVRLLGCGIARLLPVPRTEKLPSEIALRLRGEARLVGQSLDARGDIIGLGVLWYQMLTGDVTKLPPADWRRQLEELHVPDWQLDVLQACWEDTAQRLADGPMLVQRLRPPQRESEARTNIVPPEEVRAERQRRLRLLQQLRSFRDALRHYETTAPTLQRPSVMSLVIGLVIGAACVVGLVLAMPGRAALAAITGFFLALQTPLYSYRSRRARAATMLAQLRDQAQQLVREHPDEVQSWGGEAALMNRELLLEILGAFEADLRAVGAIDSEAISG